jgi:signal transduction histidine kinase
MKRRRSLLLRLLALAAAAATIPALVIALVLRSISSRALEASIEQTQMEIAQRVANEVSGEIHQAENLLAFAAQSPGVSAGYVLETQRTFQNLLRSLPSLQEVMEVSETGEERVKVTRAGATSRLIRRNLNLQVRSIGAPFFSGNRLPTVLLTEPLPNPYGRGRRGAFVAKMSFSTLGALMKNTKVGARGQAFIVSSRGVLLADVDEERVRSHAHVGKLPVVQDWLARTSEPTKLHQFVDEKGVPLIALAFPIPLLQSAVVVQQPRADVFASLERMRSQFLLLTALSVCLFLVIALLITWRIQQPLRQLHSAAEQIAAGKMNVEIDINTQDELEELGQAFGRMAQSLKQSEGLRRDLTSMIVHDLKSPLSTILASIDYLVTGQVGSLTPDQRKFLTLSHRSGNDMLMLVQNLLDVAKLEEGKMPMNLQRFSPATWAHDVLQSFQAIADAAKKQLHLEVADLLPEIEGDRDLLSRVLRNLLANAIRHSPLNTGEVWVNVSKRDAQLAVEVRDNGSGIPPEYQARIFEKFVQVEGKRAQVRTGTGLGLTFCKMVIEAHGGRIYVESVPEQGSTFTFLLPLPAPTQEATPQALSSASS